MKNGILTLMAILLFSLGSNAQNDIRQNLIYGGAGSLLYKYTFNLLYERTLVRDDYNSVGLRGGFSEFHGYKRNGTSFSIDLVVGLQFFEAGLGWQGKDFSGREETQNRLSANLGIRLFTHNRAWMARTGISLQEGIYVGVGFAFNDPSDSED